MPSSWIIVRVFKAKSSGYQKVNGRTEFSRATRRSRALILKNQKSHHAKRCSFSRAPTSWWLRPSLLPNTSMRWHQGQWRLSTSWRLTSGPRPYIGPGYPRVGRYHAGAAAQFRATCTGILQRSRCAARRRGRPSEQHSPSSPDAGRGLSGRMSVLRSSICSSPSKSR